MSLLLPGWRLERTALVLLLSSAYDAPRLVWQSASPQGWQRHIIGCCSDLCCTAITAYLLLRLGGS